MTYAYSGTFSADGNSSTFSAVAKTYHNCIARGTFGSGTLQLYISNDGTNFVAGGTNATLTAAGTFNFEVPIGCSFRLQLSGSSSPSISFAIGY